MTIKNKEKKISTYYRKLNNNQFRNKKFSNKNKLHLSEKNKISTEMYLKTIYLLNEKFNNNLNQKNKINKKYDKSFNRAHKFVKAIDLARELNINKSSVSEMIKKLVKEGYLKIEKKHNLVLTNKGKKIAKNVLRKYDIIKNFLIYFLKIKPEKAKIEACNLEHGFSDETIVKLNILLRSKKFI